MYDTEHAMHFRIYVFQHRMYDMNYTNATTERNTIY